MRHGAQPVMAVCEQCCMLAIPYLTCLDIFSAWQVLCAQHQQSALHRVPSAIDDQATVILTSSDHSITALLSL